jgi:hypothetical protein
MAQLLSTLALAGLAGGAASACTITGVKGCFEDPNDARVLKFAASGSPGNPNQASSWEQCAEWCCSEGHSGVAGMEDGGQCFCGNAGWSAPAGSLRPDAECAVTKCKGNASQPCGNNNRIAVFTAACKTPCAKPPVPPGPNPRPAPPPGPPGPSPWGPGTPNWMPCEVEPAPPAVGRQAIFLLIYVK